MEYNFGILNKREKAFCEKIYYKARKNRTYGQAQKYIWDNFYGDTRKAHRWQMFDAISEQILICGMLYWFFANISKLAREQ